MLRVFVPAFLERFPDPSVLRVMIKGHDCVVLTQDLTIKRLRIFVGVTPINSVQGQILGSLCLLQRSRL